MLPTGGKKTVPVIDNNPRFLVSPPSKYLSRVFETFPNLSNCAWNERVKERRGSRRTTCARVLHYFHLRHRASCHGVTSLPLPHLFFLFSFSSGIVLVVARARHRIESPLGVNVISEGINYVGTRKIAISRMLGRSLLLRPSPSRPYTTPSQPVPFHPRGIAFARVVSRRYFGIGWWWVARCFNHRFHDDPGTPSDSRGPAPGFNTSRPVHGSPRCYLSGPTTVIFFPHARRRFAARKRSFETAKSPPAGCSNQRPTISFFLSPSPPPFAFRVASRRIDPRITKKRVYNLCMELLIDSPHRFNDRFTRYKEFLSRSSPRFLAVY